MTSSPDIYELSKALFSIQNNLPPAIKDARNTFVGNDYATLNSVMETCRDALYSHGIWLVQLPCPAPVELGAGHIGLETRLTHIESGQWLSSVTVIPLPKSDPQGLGSALTYARQYSLCTILGIITEDDDGNIYITYDFGRYEEREILMAKITEADILAGEIVTPSSYLKRVINRATGEKSGY